MSHPNQPQQMLSSSFSSPATVYPAYLEHPSRSNLPRYSQITPQNFGNVLHYPQAFLFSQLPFNSPYNSVPLLLQTVTLFLHHSLLAPSNVHQIFTIDSSGLRIIELQSRNMQRISPYFGVVIHVACLLEVGALSIGHIGPVHAASIFCLLHESRYFNCGHE